MFFETFQYDSCDIDWQSVCEHQQIREFEFQLSQCRVERPSTNTFLFWKHKETGCHDWHPVLRFYSLYSSNVVSTPLHEYTQHEPIMATPS